LILVSARFSSLGSLFEQALMLTLDALALVLMEETGKNTEEMFARQANLE